MTIGSYSNKLHSERERGKNIHRKIVIITIICRQTKRTTATTTISEQKPKQPKKNFHFLTQFLNPNIILESSFPLTFTLILYHLKQMISINKLNIQTRIRKHVFCFRFLFSNGTVKNPKKNLHTLQEYIKTR